MNRGALLAGLALVAVAAAAIGGGGGRYPRGKGVFIDNLVKEADTPDHLIERLKYLGIKWIAIEIAWYGSASDPPDGKRSGPPNTWGPGGKTHNLEDGSLAAFTPALVAAGIQVWVWGFPSPDRIGAFVQNVKDAYSAAPQVSGVIIDPEKPFYRPQYGTELEDLVSRLQDLGRPVGATTYGAPYYHTSFPYEALGGVDFGMPQLYSEIEGYPAKADAAWRELGISPIIPLNGASSVHTPDGVAAQAAASVTKDGAIGWWNYRHLLLASDSKRAGRVEAVRAVSV